MTGLFSPDAVVRNFEIIGEAAKNVSKDLKTKHPEVEWKNIAGFMMKDNRKKCRGLRHQEQILPPLAPLLDPYSASFSRGFNVDLKLLTC